MYSGLKVITAIYIYICKGFYTGMGPVVDCSVGFHRVGLLLQRVLEPSWPLLAHPSSNNDTTTESPQNPKIRKSWFSEKILLSAGRAIKYS